jgi:hypothetical protein
MTPARRPAAPWHALLAPIPADVIPKRQPVASPEVLAGPDGAAIAGWEQLTVELSAGAAGLRHILVVLDARGQPISASDTVLYRVERVRGEAADLFSPAECEFYQESIGGRIEQDGSFRGTRWRTHGIETAPESEPQMESTPSEPSAQDAVRIEALVSELVRRGL